MTDVSSAKPRVRFAPSPTGYLHIGGARTALFNWLFARHTGGAYLLRIEDTDVERSTEESTLQILESLEWLGLVSDEPVVYQMQRSDIHKQYLDRLLACGAAYKCYCPKERLDELREQATRGERTTVYDKRCMTDTEAVRRHEANGDPYCIRFNVPDEGSVAFDDLVYGHMEFDNTQIGDFVLVRTDGTPTYNFTCTVDDIDMKITHICRGADHISNTPKQIHIYRAVGAEPPRFAHLPLILGTDKARLSKRHGATGVMQFRDQGILPEALVNFIALLGWAPEGGTEEVLPLDELIARFSLEKVNKSSAVFDYEKLLWMNGVYIRNAQRERIHGLVIPLLEKQFGIPGPEARNPVLSQDEWLHGVIGLAIERTRSINDFASILDFFFAAPSQYEEKGAKKHLGTAEQVAFLGEIGAQLDAIWDKLGENPTFEVFHAAMEADLRAWSEAKAIKFGLIAHPVRLAITGRTASPGLFEVLWFLGAAETRKRIAAAAERMRQGS